MTMKPRKAVAVLENDVDEIMGGALRCPIFWTRGGAKLAAVKDASLRGKRIVPVVVLPLKGYAGQKAV